MGDARKVGTLKAMTVTVGGETLVRSVTKITERLTYRGNKLYWQHGWVRAGGKRFMVEREVDSIHTDREGYLTTPFTQVDSIEPREVKRKVRTKLDDADKEWLDKTVDWLLTTHWGTTTRWCEWRRERVLSLLGATPGLLASDLFDNRSLWGTERECGESPAGVAKAWEWDGYDTNRALWVSRVRGSLERLVKKGRVTTMYGSHRGKEVREFHSVDHVNED